MQIINSVQSIMFVVLLVFCTSLITIFCHLQWTTTILKKLFNSYFAALLFLSLSGQVLFVCLFVRCTASVNTACHRNWRPICCTTTLQPFSSNGCIIIHFRFPVFTSRSATAAPFLYWKHLNHKSLCKSIADNCGCCCHFVPGIAWLNLLASFSAQWTIRTVVHTNSRSRMIIFWYSIWKCKT